MIFFLGVNAVIQYIILAIFFKHGMVPRPICTAISRSRKYWIVWPFNPGAQWHFACRVAHLVTRIDRLAVRVHQIIQTFSFYHVGRLKIMWWCDVDGFAVKSDHVLFELYRHA